MLLINDYKPEIWKRGEKCGSGTDHHIHLSRLGTHHLIIPFSRRKPGIHNRNPVSERTVEPHHRLVGQRDLRDQDNSLLALFHHKADHLHIYLSLPTAGNSVEQIGPAYPSFIVFPETFDHMLLFLRICDLLSSHSAFLHRIAVNPPLLHGKNPLLFKHPDNRKGYVQFLCYQIIFQHRIIQKGSQKPGPGLLILLQIKGKLFSPCLRIQEKPQPPVFSAWIIVPP